MIFRRSLKERRAARMLKGVVLCLAVIALGCSQGDDESNSKLAVSSGESFTFYNLSAGSIYSDDMRSRLRERLGPDAVARITILDLTLHHEAVMASHFPELFQLNQELNWPPRERVEHNITKLMYRYAKREKVPFDFVELVFSNLNNQPLLFRISDKTEGETFVETLKQKYGPPEVIEWSGIPGRTLYWKRNGDYFLISIAKNRHGQLEHHFTIYFVKNLRALAEYEATSRQRRETERENAGKSAF